MTPAEHESPDVMPPPVRVYRDTLMAAVRVLGRVDPTDREATHEDLATIAGAVSDWMTQRDRVYLARTAVEDAFDLVQGAEAVPEGTAPHIRRCDQPPSWAGPM